MDARLGRLIVEANEISQYLKKDYVFSTDKTGDSTSTYIQVTSKILKLDSKISIPSFKDKLMTLRKLMYEDPSDASLSQADVVIGRIQSADANNFRAEEKINNDGNNASQINVNNCSSCPATSVVPDDISRRNIKPSKSEENCGNVEIKNNSIGKTEILSRNASTNIKSSDTNLTHNNKTQDEWKPKEFPRKKSLRKFQNVPEPTGSFNLKTSDQNLKVSNEQAGDKLSSNKCLDSGLQTFLKACGFATSAIEKNIHENQSVQHLCAKSLQSTTELYEIITSFKKLSVEKLTLEFELRCVQAVANLRLLSSILPHLLLQNDDDNDNISIPLSEPQELLDAFKNVASCFAEFWKTLHNGSTSSEQQVSLHKSLMILIRHLGSASVVAEFPSPLTSKIPAVVADEFMNGCDKVVSQKMEASLVIIVQCYSHLELELDECKESDMDKPKPTLLYKVYPLVMYVKQLLMIIRQIQEELKSTSSATGTSGNSSESLYGHIINILSASTQLANHVEALTKSALLLTPATEVTILTLKRVSKNVSRVEESSRNLSCSYVQGGMDTIMAQDQLESLSEIQSMIDRTCMDLRNLLLDGISLGTNRSNSANKSDMSSSNTNLHSSFSMVGRSNSKRVLPATPRGDTTKQGNYHSPLVSDNRIFKHINQLPLSSSVPRSLQDQKQHAPLDHSDEISAFERTDDRMSKNEDINRSRLEMLEEESGRDSSGLNNSNSYSVFRRKQNIARNQCFRHSFI